MHHKVNVKMKGDLSDHLFGHRVWFWIQSLWLPHECRSGSSGMRWAPWAQGRVSSLPFVPYNCRTIVGKILLGEVWQWPRDFRKAEEFYSYSVVQKSWSFWQSICRLHYHWSKKRQWILMLAFKFCSGFGEGKKSSEEKRLRFTISREINFFVTPLAFASNFFWK